MKFTEDPRRSMEVEREKGSSTVLDRSERIFEKNAAMKWKKPTSP